MNGGKLAQVPRLQGRLPDFVLRELAHKIIKNPPQESDRTTFLMPFNSRNAIYFVFLSTYFLKAQIQDGGYVNALDRSIF